MSKPGPQHNLLPGQEDSINAMFYRDYMVEYFDQKVILLVDLLSDLDEYIKRIVTKELKIGKLAFKSEEKVESNKLEKYAKCELVETYYHCLETFMRLFIAHASFDSCPLMELTAVDTRQYHKKLNQIASGNFDNLNDKYNEEDTISLVLVGSKYSNNQINTEQYNNLKSWIIFCASELKKMNEYNSFKHGLSMFVGFGSVKVTNPDDGKVVFSKEGDAIHILESKEYEKQYKFNLTNIFVEYDFKVILILFYNEMIRNIIDIGNVRYVTKDLKIKIKGLHFTEFDLFKLRELFYDKENIGSSLSSYSIPLLYLDDIDEDLSKR